MSKNSVEGLGIPILTLCILQTCFKIDLQNWDTAPALMCSSAQFEYLRDSSADFFMNMFKPHIVITACLHHWLLPTFCINCTMNRRQWKLEQLTRISLNFRLSNKEQLDDRSDLFQQLGGLPLVQGLTSAATSSASRYTLSGSWLVGKNPETCFPLSNTLRVHVPAALTMSVNLRPSFPSQWNPSRFYSHAPFISKGS